MKKRIPNRLKMMLLSALFLLVGVFIKTPTVKAAEKSTVYLTIEKFTIGQGYILEPKAIEITEGEKISDILTRVTKNEGIEMVTSNTSNGWYLEGFKNVDSGNGTVAKCIQNMTSGAMTDVDLNPASQKNCNYPDLCDFSYTSSSGWCYSVNTKWPDNGMSHRTAENGDVIRIRFTLYGSGADLGIGRGSVQLPDVSTITRRMAIYNQYKDLGVSKAYLSAYNNARQVVSDMDSTQIQVNNALNALPTEEQMAKWPAEEKTRLEQEAKEKEEAERIKLLKKYTPKKTTLKSVKKAGTGKMKLTWKKVSGATGYQVYMSTKKSSGYKRVATIKKNKTVTYTKKSLKKGKTYYFKIRTYKKVGKTTYYGSYSNVRKLKMK